MMAAERTKDIHLSPHEAPRNGAKLDTKPDPGQDQERTQDISAELHSRNDVRQALLVAALRLIKEHFHLVNRNHLHI
jgi:hypothetical protein